MRASNRLVLFAAVLALSCVSALADLSADIRKILSDRLLAKATVGIEIVRLSKGPENCQVLYELNSRTPLIPASNLKIITTSAALNVLTPDFQFRTMLVRNGEDLVIWGDGDPTLGDTELIEWLNTLPGVSFEWTQMTGFEDCARQLSKCGITSGRNVVVDN